MTEPSTTQGSKILHQETKQYPTTTVHQETQILRPKETEGEPIKKKDTMKLLIIVGILVIMLVIIGLLVYFFAFRPLLDKKAGLGDNCQNTSDCISGLLCDPTRKICVNAYTPTNFYLKTMIGTNTYYVDFGPPQQGKNYTIFLVPTQPAYTFSYDQLDGIIFAPNVAFPNTGYAISATNTGSGELIATQLGVKPSTYVLCNLSQDGSNYYITAKCNDQVYKAYYVKTTPVNSRYPYQLYITADSNNICFGTKQSGTSLAIFTIVNGGSV